MRRICFEAKHSMDSTTVFSFASAIILNGFDNHINSDAIREGLSEFCKYLKDHHYAGEEVLGRLIQWQNNIDNLYRLGKVKFEQYIPTLIEMSSEMVSPVRKR